MGSVGKLVVALSLFQALADAWPDDLAKRTAVLRETVVTADLFSQSDHHTVRFFDPETKTLERRTIRDRATRARSTSSSTGCSRPSSNSAAGMVMREAMLLRQFGTAYPPAEAEIQRFFKETPKSALTALFERTFVEPVTRNGLDVELLRQASVFTHEGKRIVPGPGESYGSARELTRYLVLLEQGRIVDEFSSREIKRLIYVTERRIRYAASPALAPAAVFFKSGSLYQCKPEPGFDCAPYAGNGKNFMNSVAIVEHPAGATAALLHGDDRLERPPPELGLRPHGARDAAPEARRVAARGPRRGGGAGRRLPPMRGAKVSGSNRGARLSAFSRRGK